MLENLLVTDTYPGLGYCIRSGAFYRLKFVGTNLAIDRRIIPDADNNITYFCCVKQKSIKRKAANTAWEIVYNCSSAGLKVIHRNLDKSDLRGYNLMALNKRDYTQFKDALANHNGYIRMTANPKDAFGYIVRYKRAGKTRYRKMHDVVSALNFKKKIMFLSLKILGKYLNTA